MDTITDIERQQRAQRQQIREDAELFAALMAHKGWGRYMALIEAVAQNHHAIIMKPLENAFECTKIEFAKGVLSGLSLASQLPQLKIKEAHELRRPAEDDDE